MDTEAPPVLVVAGLGRCGSSLTMQMLAAAGIPCAGEAPGYEPPEMMGPVVPVQWWKAQQGRAVKALDPHRHRLPPFVPRLVIWLDRDPREQAKSAWKFVTAMEHGRASGNRSQVRGMEAQLRRDRTQALNALGAHRPPDIFARFETIIERPREFAETLAMDLWMLGFCQLGPAAVARMAEVVRPRSPKCLDGLLELSLVREMDHA